jgi:hypothetical protein
MEIAPRTDLSRLDLGVHLGSGGQGRVLAVTGSTYDGCPLALKRYSHGSAKLLNTSILEEIIEFPLSLEPSERDWLYGKFAWPLMLVEDRGAVCGFLMCRVDSPYYFSFQTRTQGARSVLADMAFLLNHDNYVSQAGLSVSEKDRLELLRSLAEVLARMHALGIVMGDLSPKNLLFRLQPSPSCFVIDCDTVIVNGATALRQVETPDWEAPQQEPRATEATDSFKFGLLAIRLFARDQSSADISALARVSSDLEALAAMSQERNPAARPGPGVWIDALEAATRHASSIPAAFTGPSYPDSVRSRTVLGLEGQLNVDFLMRHALGPARAVRSSARSPVISLN